MLRLPSYSCDSYGSSILQCLFYSIPFREQVINFPARSSPEQVIRGENGQLRLVPTVPFPQTPEQLAKAKAQTTTSVAVPTTRTSIKPEDKESQEYKKKQILNKGPLWALRYENANSYGMKESLYTCMKDLFEAICMNQERTGIIAPYKFYEILRSTIHETWGGSQHQDAHEFLNLLLNSVVDTVETTAKEIEAVQEKEGVATENGKISTAINAVEKQSISKAAPNSRWVHEIFEGTLTSETKCLTCENTSHRDEPFLDLSVDLDAHSSVTACLKRFSQEEMLRERDKFFCDNCGGLQEAEKRMKIKRLPKILALHLKRFRYTEDMQRMYKLFHRITYPEQLRLFNTTADAEDPDRLYDLYAVVVHIGAGPYHGHYVSVIKTPEHGWLLFDDELVEPVDKSFVMKFFGDKSNLACAYVLFYQETTAEAVKAQQLAEGRAAVTKMAKEAPPVRDSLPFGLPLSLKTNGFMSHHVVPPTPTSPTEDPTSVLPDLNHAITAPHSSSDIHPNSPSTLVQTLTSPQSPSDQVQAKKERKLAEKDAAKVEKAAVKEAKAMKKDESVRQKLAMKTTGVDARATMENSKKVESPTGKKDSGTRNIFSTLNSQMASSAKPSIDQPSLLNGRLSTTPGPNMATVGPSEPSIPNSTINGITSSTQSTLASHPASSGPAVSTSTSTSTSINPGLNQDSGGSGLSAFSRFRQGSRSLKHRPKFWPGSSSTTANSPVPAKSSGNEHAAEPPVNGSAAESKADDYAVDDSEDGSTGATQHKPAAQSIPRSGTEGPGDNSMQDEKLNRKRTSRFSLRRKGSNMLSFSTGSDR